MESVLISYEKYEKGKWRRKALYCNREDVNTKVKSLRSKLVMNVLVGQCNM